MGTVTGNFDALSAHGGQKGVHTALAAVRHWDGEHLRLRTDPQNLLF
jgi:hypothetical protein